jgi:hypothetical protein
MLQTGDKETFWLGWELVGDPGYAFHSGDAGIMGTVEAQPQENVLGQDTAPDEDASEQDEPMERDLESSELVFKPMPVNFTICAPQLLHLDMDDRPLWFNGWLLPNKFSQDKHQEPGYFEAYIKEPRDIREPGAWQLGENNLCCLTSDHVFDFSRAEKDVLQMIIDIGRHVGALGKGKR